jgi:uncharacterized protein (TIGR03067 family)
MRRTILLLAGVLLSAVALGSDSPKEYDDAMQVDKLEGTWEPVSAANFQVVFTYWNSVTTFGAWRWNYQCGRESYSGTYKIDASHKPAFLDETSLDGSAKGATRLYIYERNGDTLRLGWSPNGDRPKNFDNVDLPVITYKRVKK